MTAPPRTASGNFRLAIDRCFSIAGAGLVVTGTAVSGTVAVGDQIRVLEAKLSARVRTIHARKTRRSRQAERVKDVLSIWLAPA